MASPRTLLIAAALVIGASGCFTGQRPSFDENEPGVEMTGAPEIDAVLERLDATSARTFSPPTTTTTTKLGSGIGDAQVVQEGTLRRSITVNDVRFLVTGDTTATCDLATAECEATINDARLSDLMLTHEFSTDAFARRLFASMPPPRRRPHRLHDHPGRPAGAVHRRSRSPAAPRRTPRSTAARLPATTATTCSSRPRR